MVLLFYIDNCLIFSPYKDKIDDVCASALRVDFKIEDYIDLKKYLRIDLYRCPDGSIHIRQPYLIQSIISMIPGMDKYNSKPNPSVNPPLAKMSQIN